MCCKWSESSTLRRLRDQVDEPSISMGDQHPAGGHASPVAFILCGSGGLVYRGAPVSTLCRDRSRHSRSLERSVVRYSATTLLTPTINPTNTPSSENTKPLWT